MNRRLFDRFVPVLFLVLSLVFFRDYFLTKKVPLPFNLLASFYSPWKYYRWPGYEGGVPNKPLGNDNIKLFYPYRKFTVDELKSGRLPLWNPYVFSGNVHHATYQSSIFYPLNILYFIFPLIDAWSVMVIIQPVLVGWFTFLFLRSLKLSTGSSFFGALAFAISGWMLSHWEEVLVIEHSVLWLPLALYASNIIWDAKSRVKGVFLFIISLVCSILAGFPQIIVYVFGTVLLWNIYRWFTHSTGNRKRNILLIGISFVLTIAIGAIQWVPALESYFLAPRAHVDSSYLFKTFLTPMYYLITLFAPDFWGNPGTYNYFSPIVYLQERTIFIGLAPIIFAVYIIFKKAKGDINFWKLFTLITFSLGFALPSSWIPYVLHIPVLAVAMPVRIFILSTFGFCVLSSYGIEQFINQHDWKRIRLILFIVGGITVVLWLFVFTMILFSKSYQFFEISCSSGTSPASFFCQRILDQEFKKQIVGYATVSFRNLFVPTGLFVLFILSIRFFYKKSKYLLISASIITIVGSMTYANKLLYFSDRKFEYPHTSPVKTLQHIAGYDRVWSYGDGYIIRNILSYFHIFSPEGYEALYSLRYGSLLNTIQTNGKVTDLINRNDAILSEAGQNELMAHNPIRLRLMSLLGVKYVLEAKNKNTNDLFPPEVRFPPDLFTITWEDDIWRIWEYKKAIPRAFFASQTLVEQDSQKIVNILLDAKTDLEHTIVLEENPTVKAGELSNDQQSKVQITAYRPSDVTISVDAMQSGFVFLSDTYYLGWKAFVDGKETKIYRADFVFRAVPISSGKHTVMFVYDPISFKIGFSISSIAVIAAFISILIISKKSSRV